MNPTLQAAAWLIALIELIVALYVLALNAWQAANRHLSLLLVCFAANTFAVGVFLSAAQPAQARLPAVLMAITTAAIEPGLLLVAAALLKPGWVAGRRRLWWLPVYALAFLPALLTLLDLAAGTRLWYTGIPQGYAGGFLPLPQFTQGALGAPVRIL
ncbi:MAG TPA: hypothetical protein VF498_03545, partial [Anaerolineales bacterium]